MGTMSWRARNLYVVGVPSAREGTLLDLTSVDIWDVFQFPSVFCGKKRVLHPLSWMLLVCCVW